MKNILKRCYIFCLLLLSFGLSSAQNPYITMEGKKFKDGNGNDFFPKCMNYLFHIVTNDSIMTPQSLYVTPYMCYGADKYYDCHDPNGCDNLIEIDFDRVVQMGFNAIHLVGLVPYTDSAGLYMSVWPNVDVWDTSRYKEIRHYITTPLNDSYVTTLFGFIDSIALKAARHGLKIILDCQQNDYFINWQNFNPVNDYISALASHINSNTNHLVKEALMAYILVGEPTYGNQDFRFPKSEICERTRGWYNTIKSYDPDHLIGAGGLFFDETFIWDPGVETADFYFVHFYPYFKPSILR